MCDVASAATLATSDYDGVIVGASVHGGRHQREIVDWVKRHAITLSAMPSAFFSVCVRVLASSCVWSCVAAGIRRM